MNKPTKVFLLLLRIAVGWHFLYEGVFKLDSRSGGEPYLTSGYYVQTATARLRDAVASAPPGQVRARIAEWENDIARYFKSRDNPLSDEQKFHLSQMGDELARMVRAGATGTDFPTDWRHIHGEVLGLTATIGPGEHFTSEQYLLASEGPFRGLFRSLVADADGFERLTIPVAEARLDRRFDEILRHYEASGHGFTAAQAQALGVQRDQIKRAVAQTLADPAFRARIEDYRILSERVRREASQLTAPFSQERLDAARKKADVVGTELLAFVNEPLVELTVQAQALATPEQMRAGPPPRPRGQTHTIDRMVEWALMTIGVCLMLGLLTPYAAGAAAAQLALFYFASPPWPGLPAMAVGGHFLYVDRNFIEMAAALVLMVSGTGSWAGLDSLIKRRRKTAVETAPPAEVVA